MISLKSHFTRALGDGRRLHLAAHSHHLWPDVSFDAQILAWEDAARLWDEKWRVILEEIVPEVQSHIARHLNLPDPAMLAFAPNTHEFVLRLLLELPNGATVLTSDGEFHSFARQAARLAEAGRIRLERIPVEPLASFADRFERRLAQGNYNFVYISHVLFGSSLVVDRLAGRLAAIADPAVLLAIDGYHGFMALPTDLAAPCGNVPLHDRAFYLAGGYKYAAAGEGACFLSCPPTFVPRPIDTGWFASLTDLQECGGPPDYVTDGRRFWGATFDPSGLYRMRAVMRWLASLGIDAGFVHARAAALQAAFLDAVEPAAIPGLRRRDLRVDGPPRGNFLAFRSPYAAAHQFALGKAGIVTDRRGDTLRIGFGLYHDEEDVPGIARRVAAALS